MQVALSILLCSFFMLSANAQCSGAPYYVDTSLPTGQFSKFNYTYYEFCQWIVDLSAYSGFVTWTFPYLSTESYYDPIRLYKNGNFIQEFSGSETYTVINSTAPGVFNITFSSDGYINRGGFTMRYEVSNSALQDPFSCGNVILPNATGTFGRYPTNVPGEVCTWLISPPSGYDYIMITLNYKNISYDYIYVYDGSSMDSYSLGYFTSSSTNNVIYTTQGSAAYIAYFSYSFSYVGAFVFTYQAMNGAPPSSTSTSTGAGTGVGTGTGGSSSTYYPTGVSTASTSTGSSSCSTLYLSGETGYFSHLNYGPNEYCFWYIIPPSSYTSVIITFSYFEVEQSFDYVYIVDSRGLTVGSYTGTLNQFDVTVEYGSYVTVYFSSDGIGNANGFVASYVATNYYSEGSSTWIIEDDSYNPPVSRNNVAAAAAGGAIGALIIVAGVIAIIVVVVKSRNQAKPVSLELQSQPIQVQATNPYVIAPPTSGPLPPYAMVSPTPEINPIPPAQTTATLQ